MPAPGTVPPGGAGGAPNIAALLEMVKGRGADAGMLTQPTMRPNEPITTGLPIGPGAGPEVLGHPTSTPAGRFLRVLSERTGNPWFAELADRSRS